MPYAIGQRDVVSFLAGSAITLVLLKYLSKPKPTPTMPPNSSNSSNVSSVTDSSSAFSDMYAFIFCCNTVY
jgi:hypothetical protein